jgi:nitrogen fixation/metabolism regulation signal transduction histidine kinase
VVAIFFLSDVFFVDLFQSGQLGSTLQIIVFLTIPIAILIMLLTYVIRMGQDYVTKKIGIYLHFRLSTYFFAVILLVALPYTLIVSLNFSKIISSVASWDIKGTLKQAENMVWRTYLSRVNSALEKINKSEDNTETAVNSNGGDDLIAIQEFVFIDDRWDTQVFQGDEQHRLTTPPSTQSGFSERDPQRDRDVVRYIDSDGTETIKVYTFSLGEGFDAAVEQIKNGQQHFEVVNNVVERYPFLAFIYITIFFLPLFFIVMVIGMRFAGSLSAPVIELNYATKKVSEGDYSIQIYSRYKDELGNLVRSFNTMVQNLEHSRAALIRAENMSVWQNMARQLAHEIKNPLTPIKLSAERILRRYRNNPERLDEILEASIDVIIKEVDNLTTLLDEFRTLSRPIEIKKTTTALSAVLDDCISIFSTTYPNIRFITSAVNRDLILLIDGQHLRQVLSNLIINAIDAMHDKGIVEISAQLINNDEAFFAKIRITDSGIGIGDDMKDKIFTPYWTSKSTGTGLGLPIVERIVRDYGGRISFNSAKGIGTTFIVSLPCRRGEN